MLNKNRKKIRFFVRLYVFSWFKLVLLIVVMVGATVFNSFVNRYLLDVITQEKDLEKFSDLLLLYGFALVLVTILVGISKFVRKKIIFRH